MKRARIGAGALFVALAACSQAAGDSESVGSADVLDSVVSTSTAVTSSIGPTTTATSSTSSSTSLPLPVATSVNGNPTLLGGSVPSDQNLYFLSEDPAWPLSQFQNGYSSIGNHPLLIVGDGDFAERPRAMVSVGPAGILDTSGSNNTATMSAVMEPVDVGGVETIGRTSLANDIPLTELEWPIADGYVASMIAVGLGLDEAADLAERVSVDGTDPSIDPPIGYRVLESTVTDPFSASAHFVNGDLGFNVVCSSGGEVDLVNRHIYARTVSRLIDGHLVAASVDPLPPGIDQALLDGAQWMVGGWRCEVSSAPASDPISGPISVVPDDVLESFLESLVIVDEADLRAGAPNAELLLDRGSPPSHSPAVDRPFSSGEAGSRPNQRVQFTPDGNRLLVVGYDASSLDGVFQFIDATSGDLLAAFPPPGVGAGPPCSNLPISQDGRSWFDGASVRDTTTGKALTTFRRSGVRVSGADFSPDGSHVAVSEGPLDEPGRARVFEVSTGHEVATHEIDAYQLNCVRFFPDGERVLLPGLFPTVRVWDFVADEERVVIPVGDGLVQLSTDGTFITIADDEPRLVDTTSGERIGELPGIPIAISSNSARLTIAPPGSRDKLIIWDLPTGTAVAEIPTADLWSNPSASLNPDGSRIVTVRDGAGEIYDTTTAALISTLRLGDATVLSAAYSPDGTRIVTANNNGTVRIWDDP